MLNSSSSLHPRSKKKRCLSSLLLLTLILLVAHTPSSDARYVRALNEDTEEGGIFAEEETHSTTVEESHGEVTKEESHSEYTAEESHGDSHSSGAEGSEHEADFEEYEGHGEEHEGPEPAYAILFPWFVQLIGVVVFYILTRYVHGLPYTAVLFIIGIFMGIGVTQLGLKDQLSYTIVQWMGINAEVLLLTFLPGLLFRDAIGVNFHLFCKAFGQLLLMAFPMVLAGTTMTACIGYYIFPYNWSFNLSMTFGAILAATDPVAVAALMNEVGAPPRLKMHIGGEAMLNDGSAMVFFVIFSNLFLYEMGIEGVGSNVDLAEGFAIFFRMALGGAVIGACCGGGLILILYLLNKRLEVEENVLQVASTVTVAYLAYYFSEMVLHMSGVIAVVFCGITTNAFASGMINDPDMMESFWILLEHLLNTVLFALAGVIWGAIISDTSGALGFGGMDWAYLFILYALVVVIRFVLVGFFYPVISRIGLKSNWQEAVFASWGGLRGAVGIALSLALNSETMHLAGADSEFAHQTTQLFAMVGGIAFITLVINGTLSGPLLNKLGLVKSTATRARIVESYHHAIMSDVLDDFVKLIADSRFKNIDWAVVKHYVPILEHVSTKQMRAALFRYKDECPRSEYTAPDLKHVCPYFDGLEESLKKDEHIEKVVGYRGTVTKELTQSVIKVQRFWRYKMGGGNESAGKMFSGRQSSILDIAKQAVRATELRRIYVELLRMSYEDQIKDGELDAREGGGFVVYVLKQSLEFAYDEVNRGEPLNDWEKTQMVRNNFIERIKRRVGGCCKSSSDASAEYHALVTEVNIAIGFIEAHNSAQIKFKKEFASAEFGEANDIIIEESQNQVKMAEQVLKKEGSSDVVCHILCAILLNKEAHHVETLASHGLLMDRESTHFIEEISESIDHLRNSPPSIKNESFHGEANNGEKIEMATP